MDERWLAYLYYFNVEKDYFECHEYGEALWLDSGRPEALKGMIQAAVCLYHLENGNVRGGYAMWLRGRQYLQPVLPVYMGVDVAQICAQIDEVFQRIPQTWRDKVVASGDVRTLQLPGVQLRVADPELAHQLTRFTPKDATSR